MPVCLLADVLSPARQTEIAALQAKRHQGGAAAFHKLSRSRENRSGPPVPALFPFREKADGMPRVQMPETGLHGIHAGGGLAPRDRSKKPEDDLRQQTETEQMLTGYIINMVSAQTDADKQRVPARHMIGDEEKRPVSMQRLDTEIEFCADHRCEQAGKKSIDQNVSTIGVHIFFAPPV